MAISLGALLVCASTALATASTGAAQFGSGSNGLTGRVTGPDGAPLEGICVEAPWKFDSFGAPPSALTDEDGVYTIDDLYAGNYAVSFDVCQSGYPLASEFFENKATLAAADEVAVQDFGYTTVDATLDAPSSIAGTVTDEGGAPIDVETCARAEQDGDLAGTGRVDADGHYVIGGLAQGTYVVGFEACRTKDLRAGNPEPECYRDAPRKRTCDASATPIRVGPGERRGGIDAELRSLSAPTVEASPSGDRFLVELHLKVRAEEAVAVAAKGSIKRGATQPALYPLRSQRVKLKAGKPETLVMRLRRKRDCDDVFTALGTQSTRVFGVGVVQYKDASGSTAQIKWKAFLPKLSAADRKEVRQGAGEC